jgi:hypothetical protein
MLYDHRQVEQRKRELFGTVQKPRYHRVPLLFIGLGVLLLLAYVLF